MQLQVEFGPIVKAIDGLGKHKKAPGRFIINLLWQLLTTKKTSWEPVKHYDFLPPFSSKNFGFHELVQFCLTVQKQLIFNYLDFWLSMLLISDNTMYIKFTL